VGRGSLARWGCAFYPLRFAATSGAANALAEIELIDPAPAKVQ
jgi:hypothetical protein